MKRQLLCVVCGVLLAAGSARADSSATYPSHPPMRPLPVASSRPRDAGPAKFVDPRHGADANDGNEVKPWKTLQHAVAKLQPGDTLYLRAGIYDEHVTATASGTPQRPITIRAYPGELAIIDGGLSEFRDRPAESWEPCPGGVAGEFWSTKTYPDLGGKEGDTNVLGNFADSMIPLHGYRFRGDLQSDNPYWNITSKVGDNGQVYTGPGLYHDVATGRIHVRLAPTALAALKENNYRGETDPRKLSLIVTGHKGGSALALRGVRHVRLHDLVVRGSREPTLDVFDCHDIELDGLTLYGGSAALRVHDTIGLRMVDTACRGLAAPWTFRGSLKYRAIESKIVAGGGWDPTGADSTDIEFARCEFTDSVDGVFLGNVRRVSFHHNLLDNVSDDGLFVTAATGYDGVTPGGDVQVFQNLFSRCLTTFAFGVGHGRQKTIADGKQTGAGVWITRNVFDYRRPVHYHWPSGPDDPLGITSLGRFAGDHGSPAWEPMWIYHNTVLAGDAPRYDYLTDGWGRAAGKGTQRRVFNNIVCQLHGLPGSTLPAAASDFQADGNVLWSVSDGPSFTGDLFKKFRASPEFDRSQEKYPAGWTTHDRFADPKFVAYAGDWQQLVDLRLQSSSPAIDAGVKLDESWPDPLRAVDKGAPDVGAVPLGTTPWRVGVLGRLTAFGGDSRGEEPLPPGVWTLAKPAARPARAAKRAVLVQGYPAFDAPLVEFALRRARVDVDVLERTWFDTQRLSEYGIVAIDGSFTRAKIEPHVFSVDDLARLEKFLLGGGTLLLMRERHDLFATPEGRKFLEGIIGTGPAERGATFTVLEPDHAWLKHLTSSSGTPSWLEGRQASALRTSRGQSLIGTPAGTSVLHQVAVGRGQLIYVGWSPAASLPNGRLPATVEQEGNFEQQMRILLNIVEAAVAN